MANLESFLRRFHRGYGYCDDTTARHGCKPDDSTYAEEQPNCPSDEPTYADLIARTRGEPPEKFFWRPHQETQARQATRELLLLAKRWCDEGVDLDEAVMKPHSDLRNVPRV